MYENLIETLRFCAKNGDCHDCPYEKPCAGTMGDGLYCEAADAIEELQQTVEHYKGCSDDWYREACDYKAMLPRWIPVTERLPQEWKSVLTCQPYVGDEDKPLIRVSWYIGNGSWRECEMANKLVLPVTHWMPLPEPPKEETE